MESRELLSATFGNALTFGNDTGSSSANDVATDAAGNSYMTGSFSGKVDFDPGAAVVELTALGSTDAYVAKYAKDNTLLWVQRMGGDAASVDSSGTDVGRQIEIDGSGNVYVVGEFIGAADFGSTILSTAGTDRDGFVAKLDAGGTVLWANRWGTAAEDYGRGGVGVDSAGNVYAAGVTGSSLVTNTGYDILKFSASGSQLWSKSIVAPQQIATADLAVDSSGNAFLAGSFKGTVDFDPSSKTRNVTVATSSPSGFVLKLNTSGTYKWVTPFASRWDGSHQGYCKAQSVTLDGSGNVVVGGAYIYSVDFNPGSGTTTLPGLTGASAIQGAFVTKLNSSGGLIWARGLAANSSILLNGLDVDSEGSIYGTGNFLGTVDLDPGAGSVMRTTAGDSDIFVVKLNAAGNYSWAETFGGTGYDIGKGIAVDPTGGVSLAGQFEATIDFDPDATHADDTDILTNPGIYKNAFRLWLRQV